MKKLLLVFSLLTAMISFSFAQTPATAAKPATTKTTAVKPAASKPAAAKPATANNGVVLKKDGTPDKRYKTAPATTGQVKKDGTPDKRYKANKKN